MTKSNKKVLKYLVGIGAVSCFGLFLFNYFDKEDVLRAHPTQEITIDAGTKQAAKIPKDTTSGISEQNLKNDDILKDYDSYLQTNMYTASLNLKNRIGYSGTVANDMTKDLYVTNDNNFVGLIGSTNYNQPNWVSNPIAETSLVLFDSEGKILKNIKTGFGDTARLYKNKATDTYFMISATNYKKFDSNLNVVESSTYKTPNNGLTYNRSGTDAEGNVYSVPYELFRNENTTDNLIAKSMIVYKVSEESSGTLGENDVEVSLQSLSQYVGGYAKVTGTTVPLQAYEGLDTNGFTKFSNGTYGGIYLLSDTRGWTLSKYFVLWDSKGDIIAYYDLKGNGVRQLLSEFDGINFYFREYSHWNLMKYSTQDNSLSVISSLGSEMNYDFVDENKVSIYGNSQLTGIFKKYDQGSNDKKFIISEGDINNIFQPEKKLILGIKSTYDDFEVQEFNDKNVMNATVMNEIPFGINLLKGYQEGAYVRYGYLGMSSNRSGIEAPKDGWPVKETSDRTSVYYGTMDAEPDYAPAIKQGNGKGVIINKEEEAYTSSDKNSNNWTPLENTLITGDLNGTTSDPNSVKAYDYYDIDKAFTPITTDDFQKKINRNPNSLTNEIDWKALGFDLNTLGPQKVTYFISDSQKQITSTSKNVNVVDHKTEYDEDTAKVALRAENFTIKLTDLQALQKSGGLTQELLTGEKTSTYGNVLAWDLDKGDTYNTEVKVDPDQLAAINAAKAFGKFPLKYTLTKNNKTITKNTYVYVMGANSQQVGENGTTIFNTDPIELPWDITSTLTTDALGTKVMTDGKVVAYDFETGEDITKTTVNKVATVSPIETDLTALKALKPKNTTDKPKQTVHYAIKRGTTEESATTTVGTEVTVYYRFATVTINFKDEDGNTLYDKNNQALTYKKGDKEITIAQITLTNQIVGETINFTTLDDITEPKTAAGNGTGYDFVDYFKADNTTKVTTPTAVPVQWKEASATTDPNEYTLKYKGLLRFLSIPETMTFDSKVIRAFDQESSASKDNSPLTVGDNRKTTGKGEVKGKWKVNVTLVDDFKLQEEGSTEKLLNILYYGNTLITKTEGTTIKTNSTATTKTDIPLNNTSSFKLKIPAGQAKKGTYQATIKWDLLNAP
ncbi:hypothetical protein IGJ55_002749 [Enterococcus sp. AZ170]|uniref:hypothetical protein n=1 Tax=unclassified Enterococcus TaxID=2608891 RepID=UPI003D298C45